MCCSRPRQAINTAQRAAPLVRSAGERSSAGAQTAAATRAALALSAPVFEYVGATALTVVSPITRKTYRFDKPGARIEVDLRDRSWIAFVPSLVPAK